MDELNHLTMGMLRFPISHPHSPIVESPVGIVSVLVRQVCIYIRANTNVADVRNHWWLYD
jgi:hypothetical protein